MADFDRSTGAPLDGTAHFAKELSAPEQGGEFGLSSSGDELMRNGHQIFRTTLEALAGALQQGPGMFVGLENIPEGEREFLLSLSGDFKTFMPSDDALNVFSPGSTALVGERRLLAVGEAGHWQTLSDMRSTTPFSGESSSTPFFVLGKSDSVANHADLKSHVLPELTRASLSHVGLMFPFDEESCARWATGVARVCDALEQEGLSLELEGDVNDLITEIRAAVRSHGDDLKPDDVAPLLAKYVSTLPVNQLPNFEHQVPEFLRNAAAALPVEA